MWKGRDNLLYFACYYVHADEILQWNVQLGLEDLIALFIDAKAKVASVSGFRFADSGGLDLSGPIVYAFCVACMCGV